MTALTGNLDSDFAKASNRLTSKLKPEIISVYVESFDDISFWHQILSPCEEKKSIKFEIMTYSNSGFMDGKQGLLKLAAQTGDYLIICLDSDYDYLLPDNSENSKQINANPYIFQTYAYSIENLKCYADSLHSLCVQATHNTDEKLDFNAFLSAYSQIIYPLFIWNLYFYSIQDDSQFSIEQFCNLIKITKQPDINDEVDRMLENIREQLEEKNLQLENSFPDALEKIAPLAEALKKRGLSENNAYLFIQGHTLYDNVVLMLLKPVCRLLSQEYWEQIKELSQHPTEANDRLKSYSNSIRKIETLLSANDKFKNCFLFEKIDEDLQKYLELLNSEEKS